ncbi:MAG: hypothetical protein HQM10_16800 [Candidatus Riflebacteria bacterium]|nr:hypothetical protein [Candidatus Riflebacteria bacterium]
MKRNYLALLFFLLLSDSISYCQFQDDQKIVISGNVSTSADSDEMRINVLSDNGKFAGLFNVPETEEEINASVDRLRDEFDGVNVKDGDGTSVNLTEKILGQPDDVLTEEQKLRIMKIMACVRDGLYKIDGEIPDGGPNKGYQIVNWLHTRSEVNEVLEAAKMRNNPKMTSNQIEEAIIASIMSDSVKTPQNFLTHNKDARKAAASLLVKFFPLSQQGNLERIENICNIIDEHQISPPAFMGNMVQMFIRGKVKGEITSALKAKYGDIMSPGSETIRSVSESLLKKLAESSKNLTSDGNSVALTSEEELLLSNIGVDLWKVKNANLIDSIQKKVANPLESVSSSNPGEIAFTEDELKFLDLVGVKNWAVPDSKTAWNSASRSLIDGDSLINYFSPEGYAKIVKIRGPGTIFRDLTIWDSIESARTSGKDANSVMGGEAQTLIDSRKSDAEKAVAKIKSDMQSWIDSQKLQKGYSAQEKVSFWDTDAEPLKYPASGETLTGRDAERYEFAKEIRAEMERRLRAAQ